DIDAAWAAGVTVTNTPSVLTEDTADMAMVLMLALPRRLVEGTQMLVRDGVWAGWSPTSMLGHRLRGKALGIVGMGRIGTAVAQRARTFGLNIHYFSRNRRPPGVENPLEATYWHDLDAMIEAVDIVSLHTPHTRDRKSTRLNSSHVKISYAVFCLKKKKCAQSVARTVE